MQPPDTKTDNMEKYVVLANLLGGQIETGVLKPGERLPSMADLRERYGASQPTAERAYALLERDGLIVRNRRRGVFVADWQRAKRQAVLGISIPAKAHKHVYYERIVRGIQSVGHEEAAEILFFHENSVVRWEKVDGVILTTSSRQNYENLPQGMPAVAVLNALRSGASVVCDEHQAMGLLVKHLVSLGHRRIAYLTGGLVTTKVEDIFSPDSSQDRLGGYFEAMRSAGIEPDKQWLRRLRDPREPMVGFQELGRREMQKWLKEDWKELGCTAILAQNDETAVGIVDTLQCAGLRVPEDVSVVGFDGLDIAEYFRPRLTTAEVPLEEIGAQAARFLLEQIRMPLSAANASGRRSKEPETFELQCKLKVGDSSGPCPLS